MGSVGRCEPLTCERCGLRSIVVDETFVRQACVLLFSSKFPCFQKQHTAFLFFNSDVLLIHRIAKQNCDASYGAGGNDSSLNIIFFATQLYHARTLLDASVY
jgi:hypothetical protein